MGKDKAVAVWKALIDAKKAGKVRAIGVSNFNEGEIKDLVDNTGELPEVTKFSTARGRRRRGTPPSRPGPARASSLRPTTRSAASDFPPTTSQGAPSRTSRKSVVFRSILCYWRGRAPRAAP